VRAPDPASRAGGDCDAPFETMELQAATVVW
jgi:hypothetical protein